MATRQAGTLTTTHNATYTNPSLMPGYRGHVPTVQYRYGDTYGHKTQKYFQDYRSTALNNSAGAYSKGGYFPTNYSHDPKQVMSCKSRDRDRWLQRPNYRLTYEDIDRSNELSQYYQLAQCHREFYNDKSGEIHPITEFAIPTRADDLWSGNDRCGGGVKK